ncbi:major facilitator superfamily domain-containing protein 6-like [Hydra vulgaris]|uniref:major facilitator superfamily domain-containing protein 6-like n=1 Tax=Hydra vulgaris TaxID=6087 RepID=UPI0032EA74A8
MNNIGSVKHGDVTDDNLNVSKNRINLENVKDVLSVLTLKQVGYVLSFSYVGQIIGSVFWGVIADKTGAQRIIFSLLCFFYGILSLSIPIVSSRIGERAYNQCPIILSNNVSNSTVNSSTINSKNFSGYVPVSSTTLTYVIATLGFFMASFSGSIYSYIDAGVIEKVKTSAKRKDFGRQFMVSNIGFGCGTLISGKVMDIFPIADMSCYFVVYLVSVTFLFASCISFHYLRKSIKTSQNQFKEKEVNEDVRNKSFHKDLLKTLLNFEELKSTNFLIGLTVAFGSTSGVIVNFFNGVIIKLLRGTFNTMIMCTYLWSVRYSIFYFLKNPWLIIPLQLILHGLGLSLFFSVKSEHLKRIAPKTIHTTMFGIVQCLHSGVSMIMGSLIGGELFYTYGARKTFFYASIIAFLWSGVLSAYFIAKRYSKVSLFCVVNVVVANQLVIESQQFISWEGVRYKP